MKLDSKYFDKIRVKPRREARARDSLPPCEWPGCAKPGRHKAPKGRGHEGKFHHYCLEHVQQYNKTYNYFDGMKDDEVARLPEGCPDRPSPDLEARPEFARATAAARAARPSHDAARDPFGLLGDGGKQPRPPSERPPLRNTELKALHTLGLDETATAEQGQDAVQDPGEAPSSRCQ